MANNEKGNRVSCYFSDELLTLIEEERKSLGLARNACICMILSQYFESKKAMQLLSDLPSLMQKLESAKKEIDNK